MKEFESVDEYINYFTKKDFKVIRDNEDEKSRTVTLRAYAMGDFSEVIIKQNTSGITLKHTLNGKPVA